MVILGTNLWYKKYENLPFKMFGDNPLTGIDCTNLTRLIYRKEKNIFLEPSSKELCSNHKDNWYQLINDNIMIKFFENRQNNFEEIDKNKILPFDILLLSIGSTNIINHCAICVDKNKILHAMEDKLSWVSTYGSYYKNYTEKVYRWIDTQN